MANTMNRIMKNTARHSGVTLIELLIAVTISSVLLIGVGSVYYNSKRTYLVQTEFAQLQEGARIAVKFMVEDIRMAGFMGCVWNNDLKLNFQNFLNNTGSAENETATSDFAVGATGFEATATGPSDTVNLAAPAGAYSGATLPTYFNPAPLPGSDIIILRFADGNGVRLSQNKDAANFRIFDLGDPNTDGNNCHVASGICQDDILIATDCQKSRMFQATNVSNAVPGEILIVHAGGPSIPGNAIPSWGGAASDDSFETEDTYIFKAVSNAYFIAINLNGNPALFRMPMRPNAIALELISGVENMQILYGVDTDKILTDAIVTNDRGDGIANAYVTANNVVTINENIVSIRISLLLRTTNEVSSKSTTAPVSQNYLLAGRDTADGTTIATVPDRRIRKVFTTTVKLRNKGLL